MPDTTILEPGQARRGRGRCTIEGCDRVHEARGMCQPHYKRWRREQKPNRQQRSDECLTGPQAAVRANITYRQLDYWVTTRDPDESDLGFTEATTGSGTWRQIPLLAMPRVHVCADLVRFGMKPDDVLRLSHQQRLRLRAVMAPYFREAGGRDG